MAAAGLAGVEPGGGATQESFHLAYSIMDSSRVSTFFISILLIVYGSFRSLQLEEGRGEEGVDEKDRRENSVTTLDSVQAMCLPLGASVSLLIMFFFFDSMQLLFAVCTAVIATVALAFLLLPMCQVLPAMLTAPAPRIALTPSLPPSPPPPSLPPQYLVRPCTSTKGKISLGLCGRFTLAELLSVSISIGVVCVWVLTGHWALMDFMGMGLCVAFIAFVRLPSLKVSTLLLSGLLLYDVFWVFFSQVPQSPHRSLTPSARSTCSAPT
jgi:signal peptide peptidase-like protein 3